jgi:hypothetical protein
VDYIDNKLTKNQIFALRKKYGDYIKLTVDIANKWIIAGGELHADAEKILLEKKSKQDSIWGGGINLVDKQIDSTAVLNLRPRLNNDNLEILNPDIRAKFHDIIKEYFSDLWH